MPKKSFIDSIEVKTPCSESWDEMVGTNQIRFCSHCAKSVNDISAMTRKEAIRLINASSGRLCIRYVKNPKTGLPVFVPKIAAIARQAGVAAGVLSASIMIAPLANAQSEAQLPIQIERVERAPGGNTGSVTGTVTDPNGAVIPYAVVTLFNTDTYETFVQNGTGEGTYEFKEITAGNYKLRFEGGGFELREIDGIRVSADSEYRQNAQLAVQQVNETVQVGGEQLVHSVTVGVVAAELPISGARPNDLVTAAYNEDLDELKARILMRAKINARDKTREGVAPLHVAIEMGNLEMAQFLLDNGAKPNIRDYQKRTPLMMMDEDATPELFQLLVSYGAKLNLVDKEKNNALHHFAGTDNGEIIRLLVQYGVDSNALNKEGKTPLMIAAESDNFETVKALLQTGADPRLGSSGKTAWEMTSSDDIRGLLESYGAVAVRDV